MKDQKEQTIKANFYAYSDIIGIAALVFAIISAKRGDKLYATISGMMFIFAILLFILQLCKGQTKVSNQSQNTIYAKPEEGAEPVAVPPQGQCYGIDGIKAQGKVYKLPDGVHATVSDCGSVRIASIIGTLIYLVRGGLLQAPPDGGWQKLFER